MLTCRWTGRTLFVLKSQNMKEVRSILKTEQQAAEAVGRLSGGEYSVSESRGEEDKFQATGSVHNVHPAAGSEHAPWVQR